MPVLSVIRCGLAFPHILVYRLVIRSKPEIADAIKADIRVMNERCHLSVGLAYYLANRAPYRNVFYFRIGGIKAKFLKILLPEYRGFYITPNVKELGGGVFALNHPYGTILNARRIGTCFSFCQLTTLGNKDHGRNDLTPIIGDNVTLGANVSIIGKIIIGDNVVIGAGSVVVKNVPDNCIVAGNPARIIQFTSNEESVDSRSL